jgi:ketosteroid isomerase-like protein
MIGAIIGKRKVRSQYDYLNRHAIKAFMAGFAKDATFVYPGNVSASGEIKGKKAIEKWFHSIKDLPVSLKNTSSKVAGLLLSMS